MQTNNETDQAHELEQIPRYVRAAGFAAVELMLDVLIKATKYYRLGMDAMLIFITIAYETMKPIVLDPKIAETHLTAATVPDHLRGSVSRRAVAERTGLARETVRRRIGEMLALGVLKEAENGNVLIAGDRLGDPRLQELVRDVYAAVRKYQQRIDELSGAPE